MTRAVRDAQKIKNLEAEYDRLSHQCDKLRETLREALSEIEATTDESVMGVGKKAQHRLWMAEMWAALQEAGR